MKRATLVLFILIEACQPEPKQIVLKTTPPLPATGALVVSSAGPSVMVAATAEDKKGKIIRGAKIAFSSSDPRVATVDLKGVVSVLKSGTARIAATSGKARAEFEVTASIPSRLEVCPAELLSLIWNDPSRVLLRLIDAPADFVGGADEAQAEQQFRDG